MAISSNATGLRPGVCTSTTRPTTPYTGQIIYETDTGYLRVWDGAAWDYLSQKQDDTIGLGPVGGLVFINRYTINGGSVNLTSCFSSNFLNYRIVVDLSSAPSGYIRAQMLSGTTPSTGTYSSVGNFSYLSGGTQYNDNIGTGNQGVSSAIVGVCGGSPAVGELCLDVIAPFDSRATTGTFASAGHSTNSGLQFTTGGFIHYTGGSFDGIYLFVPSGTIVGTARVYGYRN